MGRNSVGASGIWPGDISQISRARFLQFHDQDPPPSPPLPCPPKAITTRKQRGRGRRRPILVGSPDGAERFATCVIPGLFSSEHYVDWIFNIIKMAKSYDSSHFEYCAKYDNTPIDKSRTQASAGPALGQDQACIRSTPGQHQASTGPASAGPAPGQHRASQRRASTRPVQGQHQTSTRPAARPHVTSV